MLNNYSTKKEVLDEKPIIKTNEEYFGESEHGSFTNIDVDNASLEELYQRFKITRGKSDADTIKDVDMRLFQNMNQEVKKAEIKLYAFLNKEFNILNKKYINCCFTCYKDPSVIYNLIIRH